MSTVDQRRDALLGHARELRACTRCTALAAARTHVVVGEGDPDADVVLVGEAPTRDEDAAGAPLLGRAGALLDDALRAAGLARADVFVLHLVRCRPPDNRDPSPGEVAACDDHLRRTLALVAPRVVCPLGHFATRALRGDPAPITHVRGRAEAREIAGRRVHLLPLFHPAAALYTRATTEAFLADVALLPGLLALPVPGEEPVAASVPPAEPVPVEPESVESESVETPESEPEPEPDPDPGTPTGGSPGKEDPPGQLTLL